MGHRGVQKPAPIKSYPYNKTKDSVLVSRGVPASFNLIQSIDLYNKNLCTSCKNYIVFIIKLTVMSN